MTKTTQLKVISSFVVAGAPIIFSGLAFAASADGAGQFNNFLTNIIKILTGIASLLAVAFIVIGGLHYITSSGNPERLDKAKRTIMFAGIGLVITIAAFSITDVMSTSANISFGAK